jgi:molybdopterin synthase sulfur carrier subunit
VAITVRIPSALRTEAGGESSVQAGGETLRAVLDGIAAQWPRLDRRLRDERGELRRFINVYVAGEECRRLAGLDTPVPDRAEVLIVPSVAGG